MCSKPIKAISERAAYVRTALVVAGLLTFIVGMTWLVATRPPGLGYSKSFGPGWRCEHIEYGAQVCSRISPPPRRHPDP